MSCDQVRWCAPAAALLFLTVCSLVIEQPTIIFLSLNITPAKMAEMPKAIEIE
jgi:hypothetical protein